MDSLRTDLRHVLRGFRRWPGFALLVVAVLAVGLGANAVVFSVVDSVLLRPLPLPEAAELFQVWSERDWFSKEEVDFLRENAEAFDVAGYYTWAHFAMQGAMQGDAGSRVVQGSYVTAGSPRNGRS